MNDIRSNSFTCRYFHLFGWEIWQNDRLENDSKLTDKLEAIRFEKKDWRLKIKYKHKLSNYLPKKEFAVNWLHSSYLEYYVFNT